jgi:hypothetical protein
MRVPSISLWPRPQHDGAGSNETGNNETIACCTVTCGQGDRQTRMDKTNQHIFTTFRSYAVKIKV